MAKIHNHVEIIDPGVKWKELHFYLQVRLLHFTTAAVMSAAWVQHDHSRMFWCIQISQLFQVIHILKGLCYATRNEEK